MYPLRIVRKDSILVKPREELQGDMDFTGLTDIVWTRLDVTNIVDTGVYVTNPNRFGSPFEWIDWEKLQFYRVLIIRKGASKKPGRSWELVERWYLHKISVEGTIAAYEHAWRTQSDPRFVRPPRMRDWEIR